jgi:hypothetical protein
MHRRSLSALAAILLLANAPLAFAQGGGGANALLAFAQGGGGGGGGGAGAGGAAGGASSSGSAPGGAAGGAATTGAPGVGGVTTTSPSTSGVGPGTTGNTSTVPGNLNSLGNPNIGPPTGIIPGPAPGAARLVCWALHRTNAADKPGSAAPSACAAAPGIFGWKSGAARY